MKVELGLSLIWPKRCFELNKNLSKEEDIENIHISRLKLISTYLNKIFNSNKIFNIKNWNQIFFDDKLYHEVCEIKLKEKKLNKKKEENTIIKKNSIDDFFLDGINKKIKLKGKNDEIIDENEKVNENLASFDYRKNELYLNNKNESKDSFGSLDSNISKNSNVKNLLDI